MGRRSRYSYRDLICPLCHARRRALCGPTGPDCEKCNVGMWVHTPNRVIPRPAPAVHTFRPQFMEAFDQMVESREQLEQLQRETGSQTTADVLPASQQARPDYTDDFEEAMEAVAQTGEVRIPRRPSDEPPPSDREVEAMMNEPMEFGWGKPGVADS